MKNIDTNNIVELENFIQSSGHEYQAIGKEIKIYLLDDSEIHIIVDKTIEIFMHNIVNANHKYSLENIIEAKKILNRFITS
tara:strand:- start:5040 stop:5282 length:243 start_codon:yes stop_codon:yes gene_type:complete